MGKNLVAKGMQDRCQVSLILSSHTGEFAGVCLALSCMANSHYHLLGRSIHPLRRLRLDRAEQKLVRPTETRLARCVTEVGAALTNLFKSRKPNQKEAKI